MQRLHLRIRGDVQGVCFRMAARSCAQRLGVTGWVRNCPDGTVELVAEGDGDALAALRQWARRGPPPAVVTGLDVETAPATGEFDGFEIAY